jgi:hypothetical protein
MTQEEARYRLEDYINANTMDQHGEHDDISLPIVDEVVYSKFEGNVLTEYTFVGLLKIAYNLK